MVCEAKGDDGIEAAIKFLSELQHPRGLRELLPYLKNPKDPICAAAAKAVAKDRGSAKGICDALDWMTSQPKFDKSTPPRC